MGIPELYVSGGRAYYLRQDTDDTWWILCDREHVGTLNRNQFGWIAYAPGDDPADDERTPTWQPTLESLLDYLR